MRNFQERRIANIISDLREMVFVLSNIVKIQCRHTLHKQDLSEMLGKALVLTRDCPLMELNYIFSK